MSDINTVLFDVGNVIASDYWEAMWLTKAIGLADRLSLDLNDVRGVCHAAWDIFSVRYSIEEEYWIYCSERLGISIDQKLINSTEELVIGANKYIFEKMVELSKLGKRIGIISNNTAFWYPKQIGLVNISSFIDESLIFLSCKENKTKSEGELFRIAAKYVNSDETLIIDDRLSNIDAARSLGFATLLYDREVQDTFDCDGYFDPPAFCDFDLRGVIYERR